MENYAYGSNITEKGNLEIIKYIHDESKGKDTITKTVLTLREANSANVKNARSRIFDDEDELMDFINDQKRRERFSPYISFLMEGYKIVDDHFIQLFYNTHASNS